MCGDEFSSVLFQLRDRLGQNEARLMDRRPEDLQNQIQALKNKTEQNRKMARDAREAADAALRNSTDSEKVRLLTSGGRVTSTRSTSVESI